MNEAHVLESSIERVRHYLTESGFPHDWRIVIVNNGSTDATGDVAASLSASHPDVVCHQLQRRGRGLALRHAWTHSSADAVCYMDVDLSTELTHIQPLIAAILDQGFDVAIGSRLLPGSRTGRSLKREFISRAYNLIVRLAFHTHVKDAQCGFKAASRSAVERVVPRVVDDGWFFDTELLVLAEAEGMRINEIPVNWHEDPDSRVKLISTAIEDLKGILRVWRTLRRRRPGQEAPAEGSIL
ncbi:MAG: glycosyltransferase family 2 protein [Bryobacteraceae bacterium]|nr:glycosyltransferase family 2 protein [Bryobacteraceae bacterium]